MERVVGGAVSAGPCGFAKGGAATLKLNIWGMAPGGGDTPVRQLAKSHRMARGGPEPFRAFIIPGCAWRGREGFCAGAKPSPCCPLLETRMFQRGLVGWPWQGAGTPSARLPKTSWIPQAGRWRIGRRESLQATGTGLQQMALAWALAAGCKCSWRRKRKLPPGPSLSGEAILRLRALSAQKTATAGNAMAVFCNGASVWDGETGAGSGAQNHGSIPGMRGKALKRPNAIGRGFRASQGTGTYIPRMQFGQPYPAPPGT